MAGYTRQDTTGQIANNEVIDADDLNAEFNAVQTAFSGSSGHNHDPSSSNSGAPIEKVGPAGQVTVNSTQVLPNGDNTIDLGGSTSSARFKNGRFGSTVSAATLDGDTVVAGSNGYMTLTDNELDVSSGNLLVDVAGDMTVDVAGGNILLKDAGVDFGSLNNVSGNMTIKSGTTDALQFTGANADFQGTLDVTGVATLDNNLTVAGNVSFSNATNNGSFTVTPPSTFTGLVTGNGGFSGLLTGNVKGDVVATNGTVVLQNGTDGSDAALTGTVSSLSNHDTDNLSEGTSNLYHTTARAETAARGAVSVTKVSGQGDIAYNSTTGVISYTGPTTSELQSGLTGGTGVSISNGEISIGQAVATNSDVTFNDVITSADLTVGSPLLTLGGDTAPVSNDQKDRGAEFRWHDGTNAKLGFFGFNEDDGKFTFIPEATKNAGIFSGTTGTIVASFEGSLTGSVTGNVTGNVSGSAGTVTSLSGHNTDDVSEGSTNLYHTTARARNAISASGGISYDSSTGVISSDSSGTVETNTIDLGAWTITQSGTDLKFAYNGTDRLKLSSTGALTVENDVTAFGNA